MAADKKHQEYTNGFMFSEDCSKVALIEKQRPDWQRGRLNGIGGHREDNETPLECQCREFMEETGKVTSPEDWHLYCTLQGTRKDGRTYRVHFYWAVGDISDLHTMTDERVVTVNPIAFDYKLALDNVPWLLYMAMFDGQNHHYLESMEYRRAQ